MRLAVYAGASVLLATGVILKALHQRANFFAAFVYLSRSSANLMITTNLLLLITGCFLYWLQRLLYGPLRPIEVEQLYEKAWFAVTETCLAMTIFRGELGGWFLVMFLSLLVGKVWEWIGEGRVEYLEQQPPANPWLFHTRLAISLLLSLLFDSLMLEYCVKTVLDQARPDMMVMFGFEFAVLTILSSSTAARYAIASTEILISRRQLRAKIEERRAEIRATRDEMIRNHATEGANGFPTNLPDENEVNEMEIDIPGWEDKGRWVFYLDLLTDFLKLIVYLAFFFILFAFYGLPLHILRDVLITIRSFGRRIVDFMRYRYATRDMNDRYPDATADEVAREDVCIICREEMTPWQPPHDNAAAPTRRIPERLRPKKLPCGHILHFSCLRSWLERQQNCPTCRRPLVAPARNRDLGAVAPNDARGMAGPAAQLNEAGGNQLPGANAGQPNGAPRARIYRFGPFRIGFGAGRGDLFQNLHQQIPQPNAPLQQPANGNAQDAMRLGLGLGFARPAPTAIPPPSASPGSNMANIHLQLQQIEQQLHEEINSLRVTAQQLHLVRLLQTELQRLRLQASIGESDGAPAASAVLQPSSTDPLISRRQFVSDPHAAIGAGDACLPEGLTLPHGWTLIPLHPSAQEVSSVPTQPSSSAVTDEISGAPHLDNVGTSAAVPVENIVSSEVHRSQRGDCSTSPAVPTPGHVPSPPSTAGHGRSDSIFPEPTTLTTEKAFGRIDVLPASAATHVSEEAVTTSDPSSSSKGKGRVATVEDGPDEETP